MKYADARPLIRSGDLLGFSHGDWRTWSGIKVNIVRMFTRSTYSHVALAWVVGGRVLVIEAVKPKARIYPLSLLGDFWRVPMGAAWLDSTEVFAMRCIGVDYSELVALLSFFGPLDQGNVQQCAALVREVLLCDGIDLGSRSTPDAVMDAAIRRSGEIDFVSGDK